jgi:hypothetical protein
MPSCKVSGVAPLSASSPTSRFCSDLSPDMTDSRREASAAAQHADRYGAAYGVTFNTACKRVCSARLCRELQLVLLLCASTKNRRGHVMCARNPAAAGHTPASRQLMASWVLQRLKLMLLVWSHALGSLCCFLSAVSASLVELRSRSVAIICRSHIQQQQQQ